MMPIERIQTSLPSHGLKTIEARLENPLEQASKKEPSYADFLTNCWGARSTRAGHDTCGLVCNWRICPS
jgi:hypothetical protein